MNNLGTQSVDYQAPATPEPNGAPVPPERRKKSILAKAVPILLVGGLAAGGYYAYSVGPVRVQHDIERALNRVRTPSPEASADAKPQERRPYAQWDGFVKLDPEEAKNVGLLVVTVQPQSSPIKLELPGRTAYDPNSLNKIRPRFDTLVEKVYVELGKQVKKGDPLVDLFSTDLAAAKNDFQTAYVQWQRDLALRELREELIKTEAISKQVLIDTRNDENKSRLAVTTARKNSSSLKFRNRRSTPSSKT